MNGRRSKQLRRMAEDNTIGQKEAVTRKEYKRLKKEFKASRHNPSE